jgi:hypothetical protein
MRLSKGIKVIKHDNEHSNDGDNIQLQWHKDTYHNALERGGCALAPEALLHVRAGMVLGHTSGPEVAAIRHVTGRNKLLQTVGIPVMFRRRPFAPKDAYMRNRKMVA